MTKVAWPRLGLRREVLILLPLALLLLVLISAFVLFSYRSAIDLLIDARQTETAQVAHRVATQLAAETSPSTGELRQLAPLAARAAVVDSAGGMVVAFGEEIPGGVLTPLGEKDLQRPIAVGPDATVGEFIAGFAPFERGGATFVLRLDMPATYLAQARRTARRLTWVVVPLDAALLVLVLLFVPHLLRPYDALLAQAQAVGRVPTNEDEVSFLVKTVQEALARLGSADQSDGEDDIAALQRALGASLESGLLLLDRAGKVLALNPLGASLLEVEAPTAPTDLNQLLGDHSDLAGILSHSLASSSRLTRQEVAVRTAAGPRTVGLTVHALRRDDGSVRGHLVLFVDLTESRREAEAKQLATSLAQLGELAAGIAHELRNSLATLHGYLTLIERRPDEESITDYVQEIRRESDHLQRVLEDFLSFARPGTARIEAMNLKSVLHLAAADPALGDATREIDVTGEPIGTLQGDPELLVRALRNLIHNAVRAAASAASQEPVRIVLCRVPDAVEIRIEDRGPGIPSAIRERLFQPFVTDQSNGVGLGLSLAYRIVDMHGGSVELQDRSGGGTSAVISFPREIFTVDPEDSISARNLKQD